MKMDRLEIALLIVLLVTSILGLYWGFYHQDFFTNRYMMEDGEIEYATVVLLFGSCILVASRWIKYRRQQPIRFTLISILIFIVFFFVAGEELSWGQRIFNLESSQYFKEYNSQEELNLHNLTVGEVKINKLIFGVTLTTAILIYMILVPLLYQKVAQFRRFIDAWFIPVPRVRHIVTYLLLLVVISVIPASKNWELLEFGSVLVFTIILWNPVNQQSYRPSASIDSGDQ